MSQLADIVKGTNNVNQEVFNNYVNTLKISDDYKNLLIGRAGHYFNRDGAPGFVNAHTIQPVVDLFIKLDAEDKKQKEAWERENMGGGKSRKRRMSRRRNNKKKTIRRKRR